jgi:DNA-binding transcriptional MerR regulator
MLERTLDQGLIMGTMAGTPLAGSAADMSIGQVAQRTGLSVHALRFYEREGLLVEPVQRAPDGRRRYSVSDVEWLDVCTKLRSSGMPLSAICRYAELVRQGAGNEHHRLALLRQHQESITAQIAALNSCLKMIDLKVKLYEESVADHTVDPIWSR